MIKHYVEYLHPGLLLSDSSRVEISERTLDKVLPLDDHTFGFRFFDREEVESNGEKLIGEPKNYSNWYYIGTKLTKKQVIEKYGEDARIVTNMGYNDVEAVVETKFGQSIPLEKDDIVIG